MTTVAPSRPAPANDVKYKIISADSHIDLIWLPPDLFTKNASAAFKDRMPYVVDSPEGPRWTSKNNISAARGRANFAGGVGSSGRKYVPGMAVRTGPLTGEHTEEIRAHGWGDGKLPGRPAS